MTVRVRFFVAEVSLAFNNVELNFDFQTELTKFEKFYAIKGISTSTHSIKFRPLIAVL